jgi:hypothetical protein
MSPRLSCCQIQSLVESFLSAIEGFGSIAISTSSSLPNHSRWLYVYWVLTPPIAHLFPSCIGAAPPAEPPSRDNDPWRLGQPWIKARAIASETVSESLSPFSVCFSSLRLYNIRICPNISSLTACLLCLSLQDMLPLGMGKRKYPRSSSLPRGEIISECGVGSCAS